MKLYYNAWKTEILFSSFFFSYAKLKIADCLPIFHIHKLKCYIKIYEEGEGQDHS